jgi:D-3-phosphoglycerate dehydrogenase
MTGKCKVLLYYPMHSEGTKLLQEKCEIAYVKSRDEKAVMSQASDAEAIILLRHGEVTRGIIQSAPRLKVIGKHGVGVDKIDLKAAKERGIPVVYTPEAHIRSVSELFITLALMLAKKMKRGEMSYREGRWKTDAFEFLGTELYGKTLGILGFGRIGKQTARIGYHGFNMPVLYCGGTGIIEGLNAKRVELRELFIESDFISINLPLLPQTKGLVNADLIKLMKPTAFLINMARGKVWNEADVVQALKEKWIAGAGSDVYEIEPTSPENPLFKFDNFVGTPHMAPHTEEGMMRASLVAQDIIAVLEGRKPKFPVPENLYP